MSQLESSLSFNVAAYFSLTQAHRKIVQWLADFTLYAMKKRWKGVWPSIRFILFRLPGICERTIQRFNQTVKGIFIEITPRFNERGMQASNRYMFLPGFWNAIKWLSQRNLLNVADDRKEGIINEAKNFEEKAMSPPLSHRECHPYSSTLSETHLKRAFIHPKLEEVRGLGEGYKEILSREPERYLMLALEQMRHTTEGIIWPGRWLMQKINFYKKRYE